MKSKEEILDLLMDFSDQKNFYFKNKGKDFDTMKAVTFSYDALLCVCEHLASSFQSPSLPEHKGGEPTVYFEDEMAKAVKFVEEQCATCEGHGHVVNPNDPTDGRECPECNGTGKQGGELYSKDAVEFAEWIKDEYQWHERWDRWIPKGVAFIPSTERVTTEELYKLFKTRI